MAITIQLPSGESLCFEGTTVLVGSDSSCDIQISDAELEPQHARLRKVANRWMVESQGDWPIQAGDSGPGRSCWFTVGDVIRLSPSGPDIVIQPESAAEQNASEIPATTPPPMPGGPSQSGNVADDPSGPPPMPTTQTVQSDPNGEPPPMPQESPASPPKSSSPPPMPSGSQPPPMPGT